MNDLIFTETTVTETTPTETTPTETTVTETTPTETTVTKINIYNENFQECENNAEQWENAHGEYYRSVVCCREVSTKLNTTTKISESHAKLTPFISNPIEDVLAKSKRPLCLLLPGHTGKCTHMPKVFKKEILEKINTGIYQTPGNDDCVYKNRANRLFPICIDDEDESVIRNKSKQLKCAIPLKDRSTPLMLASAFTDYITFIVNIRGIRELILPIYHEYVSMLDIHKLYLDAHFKSLGRKIFNTEGYTVCPVTGYEIKLRDVTDVSRTRPRPTDIQLGHCVPRSNTEYTIRGLNICLMTRDGNRIVGDADFMNDEWIKSLKNILAFQAFQGI